MKKLIITMCCGMLAYNAFAAGADITFFGYKVCDVSFDANPFSRESLPPAAYSDVYSPRTIVTTTTPVVRETNTIIRRNEPDIAVNNSSNVVINVEKTATQVAPVYNPAQTVVYPTSNNVYYTYPVTYTYPAYYSAPVYYYRPYYRHHHHHRRW